jgi:hypothetical protein
LDGKLDQIDDFRRRILDEGLSKQQSLLALHRLGQGGFLEEGSLLQGMTSNAAPV